MPSAAVDMNLHKKFSTDRAIVKAYGVAGVGYESIGILNALFHRQEKYCWASELSSTRALSDLCAAILWAFSSTTEAVSVRIDS